MEDIVLETYTDTDSGKRTDGGYPEAKYILIYLSLFLGFVILGALFAKIFYSASETAKASIRGAATMIGGGFSETLLRLAELLMPSVIELIAIFFAPLTIIPSAVRGTVISYRGMSLGWCLTVTAMCSGAYAAVSVICYAAASALIILFSAESGVSCPQNCGIMGKVRYLTGFLVMSSIVFALELLPKLIFFR